MKFLFVIFLLPLQLFAQDITGVWTGTLYSDSTQFIKYELAISEYNGKLSGYSHTTFVVDGVENIGVKSIKIKKVGKEFLVEDDKLVYNNYTDLPPKGVKQYSELSLSQNDTAVVLSGSWKTNRTKEYAEIKGDIFLQKKNKIRETPLIAKLENLGLTHSLSFMDPLDPTKDPGTINAGDLKPGKGVRDSASKNGVTADNKATLKTESQSAGKIVSETVLTRGDTVKEKAPLKNEKLVVAGNTVQKEGGNNNLQPGNISTKADPSLINKQQKTGKEISNEVLNTKDSVLNKEKIKASPALLVEKPAAKSDSTSIASIKTQPQQKEKLPNSDKEITGKELTTKDNTVNKEKVKEGPALVAEKRVLKNDSAITVSAQTTVLQKAQQPNSVKENSAKASTNGNSAMSKDIVEAPSSPREKSISKNDSANSVSLKAGAQEITTQQNTGKIISGVALKKDNHDSVGTVSAPVSHAAAEVASRKIEAIRTVDIKRDSLVLTLYDNGEVDGDTVSVLLNGKVIMPMEGLSLKAINKTIYLTPEMGDSIVLIMYAENLGSIPPNTGLLVIHDGDDVYEIRFTGDFEKNSSIILRRRKK